MLSDWINAPWFYYTVSQPITLRHFNLAFLIVGVSYVVCITLLNVAAVGYQPVTVTDSDYNKTVTTWYTRFLENSSLFPEPWTCHPATVSINDGFTLFCVMLMAVVDTTTGFYEGYLVAGFDNSNVDDIVYANNSLVNCDLRIVQLTQSLNIPVQDNVPVSPLHF
jgi:hypothetical protein